MRTFLDSSAFAKRYVDEVGSAAVDEACAEAGELALCILCVPEILSALNRRVREGTLSRRDYGRAKQRLAEDVADAIILDLTPAVIARTATILEHSPARAMDALHMACAVEWGADVFVSADRQQLLAAKQARLPTRFV